MRRTKRFLSFIFKRPKESDIGISWDFHSDDRFSLLIFPEFFPSSLFFFNPFICSPSNQTKLGIGIHGGEIEGSCEGEGIVKEYKRERSRAIAFRASNRFLTRQREKVVGLVHFSWTNNTYESPRRGISSDQFRATITC